MTKARELSDYTGLQGDLAGLQTNITAGDTAARAGRKNLIINGGMQVSQRNTSVSSQTGSGYKTVDRFYTNASGATYNQSQQTVTVGGETGLPLQFSKFLRHQVTTGNNWSQVYHKVEDVASVPSGTVTLSFYAKGTSPDAGLTLFAWQNFGSGGSGEVAITISPAVTLTSTWQRFTVNITVPSITGKTIGTGSYFYFGAGQGGSASTNAWTLDITGIQLELGSVATDFEHRSFGEELALCQRYFQTIGGHSTNETFASGFTTANNFFGYGKLNGTMRSPPTLSVSGSIGHISYTHPALAANAASMSSSTGPNSFYVNIFSLTSTSNGFGAYARVHDTSTRLFFDAEL